jgi:uncharacterized membrane protein YphA (DoxX/SURF4 family)
MKQFVRFLEILLGLVFVLGAVTKALDIDAFANQIKHYGFDFDLRLLRFPAIAAIAVETVLGSLMVAGLRFRGVVAIATSLLLLVFSGLIAYGWAFYGLKDCGCFGAYLSLSPGPSILKNAVMIAVAVTIFVYDRRSVDPELTPLNVRRTRLLRAAVIFACVVSVIGTGIYSGAVLDSPPPPPTNTTAPFAQFKFSIEGKDFDLSTGIYFVAILSATCDHCQDEVPAVNELMILPDCPVIGIMLGSNEEIDVFRQKTMPQFPTARVESLVFFELFGLGESAPKFCIIVDGKAIKTWSHKAPTFDECLSLVESLATETKVTPAAPTASPDAVFARFQFSIDGSEFDLSQGKYFVALLSATCEHCQGEVPALNELAILPDYPVIGLMLGSDDKIDAFRKLTNPTFPTQRIDDVDFYNLLRAGETPPKFCFIENGKPVKVWLEKAPTLEEFVQLAEAGTAPS